MANEPKDEKRLVELLTKRQLHLEQIRRPLEPFWEDLGDYFLPNRSDIKGTHTIERPATKIYDTTGMNALNRMVSGIHGYTINPALEWMRLRMSNDTLDSLPEVRRWLQECEYGMYAAFNRSNFYHSAFTFLEDGYGIGTATMFPVEDVAAGKIVFMPSHPGEIFIGLDNFGRVDVLHRKFKLTARQIDQQFKGTGDKKVVPDMIRMSLRNDPFKKFDILHCIYPRSDFDAKSNDPKNKPIASVWIAPQAGYQKLLRVSGFDRIPYVCWRFNKAHYDVYGRGRAIDILPEVMSLQVLSKTLLGAAEKAVDPPWMVPPSMAGNLDLMPRGQNFYDASAINSGVPTPLVSGMVYPVGIDREDRLRRAINEHFHNDFFMMLAQQDRKQMTAREVAERQSERAVLLSPIISGFEQEGLDPLVQKVFHIEYLAGRIPEAPEIVLETGIPIKVDYVGPFAQAQQAQFKSGGIRRTLEILGAISQYDQGASDVFDLDEMLRGDAEANALPAKYIRLPEDVEAIRTRRAEAQQAQEEQLMVQTMAESAKSLSEADKNTGGALAAQMQEALATGG